MHTVKVSHMAQHQSKLQYLYCIIKFHIANIKSILDQQWTGGDYSRCNITERFVCAKSFIEEAVKCWSIEPLFHWWMNIMNINNNKCKCTTAPGDSTIAHWGQLISIFSPPTENITGSPNITGSWVLNKVLQFRCDVIWNTSLCERLKSSEICTKHEFSLVCLQ